MKQSKQRTNSQNSAMHLYFDLIAQSLNDAGLDVRHTLKQDVEIPWNKDLVKELIWKKIMKAMYGYESTTEMNSSDVSKVMEVITRHLGERFGLTVDFPSIETIINNQRGEYES